MKTLSITAALLILFASCATDSAKSDCVQCITIETNITKHTSRKAVNIYCDERIREGRYCIRNAEGDSICYDTACW